MTRLSDGGVGLNHAGVGGLRQECSFAWLIRASMFGYVPLAGLQTNGRAFAAQSQFLQDLIHWEEFDSRVATRVLKLVEAVLRDLQESLGKPEPFRGAFRGCWSRRITQEHRLVYRIPDSTVDFLQSRYHYE